MNIYKDNVIYPLTDNEINKLDDVWNFINEFHFVTISLNEYRKNIINIIRNKYSLNEFLDYENIMEKILWNLQAKTKYLFQECQNCINHVDNLNDAGMNTVMDKFYDDNSYRSFINKLVLINDKDNEIYYRKMEGSSNIFTQNEFNTKLWMALNNRNRYEKIMNDPKKINLIEIPGYYYLHDYALPNLNFAKPFIQSTKHRYERIRKMYYDDNAENNWFKLIKN